VGRAFQGQPELAFAVFVFIVLLATVGLAVFYEVCRVAVWAFFQNYLAQSCHIFIYSKITSLLLGHYRKLVLFNLSALP
jgi:Ni,Fe-hydrogenase I cytochrome b subunit